MNVHALYRRLSPLFRRRRMRWLLSSLQPGPGEAILDVGGTPSFWSESPIRNSITLLNPAFVTAPPAAEARFTCLTGDGCALPFADRAFPTVVSNSVIEHLGSPERQRQFAREVRRVGGRLWIQNPAREFPVEPHYLAPGIHWLPVRWQRRLIRNFTLRGWLDRPGPAEVEAMVAETRLLGRREFAALFPDCDILVERFLGLPKSYIARRIQPK